LHRREGRLSVPCRGGKIPSGRRHRPPTRPSRRRQVASAWALLLICVFEFETSSCNSSSASLSIPACAHTLERIMCGSDSSHCCSSLRLALNRSVFIYTVVLSDFASRNLKKPEETGRNLKKNLTLLYGGSMGTQQSKTVVHYMSGLLFDCSFFSNHT
jgi:hypothetical protein